MGWEQREFKMVEHTSAHNSRNDEIDRLLWEEMVKEIRYVIDRPRYTDPKLDIVNDGIDWDEYYSEVARLRREGA